MNTRTIEYKIKNKLGLHARPAAVFVQLASGFKSDIAIEKDGEKVDGKSVLGLLMLAAGFGSDIKIIATGEDSETAIAAINDLVSNSTEFNEE
ncbi:MAG: HPr family phosphocarrier protein [bacterium]|nr:HPr family phosphocarrier protein [bacterium]